MSYMTDANRIADQLRGGVVKKQSRNPLPIRQPNDQPTQRNLEVLAYMREFFAENDQLPPMESIKQHFGWRTISAVDCHLKSLMRHKLVERNAVGKMRFVRRGGAA